MNTERHFHEVLGQVYEAALDPSRMHGLAGVIADAFQAETAILFAVRRQKHGTDLVDVPSFTPTLDGWAGASYGEYYHKRDEWFARGHRIPAPAIVIGQELIDDTSFERTEFCADWCEKLDVFHLLGAHFEVGDTIGALGVLRARKSPYGEAERQQAAMLLPHLQRTLQIRHRIASAERDRKLTMDVIEGLAISIVIADAEGRVIFANRAAERTLSDGRNITILAGRIRPRDPRQGGLLSRTIFDAAMTSAGKATSAGGMVLLPGDEGRPLSLLISPLRDAEQGFGRALPAAAIIFSDPNELTAVPAKSLERIYGLTPAEAKLLEALLAGKTLAAYADGARISGNTAKTHLRHVFEKTGYARQIDLVRATLENPSVRLSLSK